MLKPDTAVDQIGVAGVLGQSSEASIEIGIARSPVPQSLIYIRGTFTC